MRAIGCFPVLAMLGCAAAFDARQVEAPPPARAVAPAQVERIILVTVDGVRAKDVLGDGARARLPNLWRRVDGGVGLGAPGVGAPLLASGPRFVSLPGYREILTGRRGLGCTDNQCAQLAEPSLLDDAQEALGLDAADVALVA